MPLCTLYCRLIDSTLILLLFLLLHCILYVCWATCCKWIRLISLSILFFVRNNEALILYFIHKIWPIYRSPKCAPWLSWVFNVNVTPNMQAKWCILGEYLVLLRYCFLLRYCSIVPTCGTVTPTPYRIFNLFLAKSISRYGQYYYSAIIYFSFKATKLWLSWVSDCVSWVFVEPPRSLSNFRAQRIGFSFLGRRAAKNTVHFVRI